MYRLGYESTACRYAPDCPEEHGNVVLNVTSTMPPYSLHTRPSFFPLSLFPERHVLKSQSVNHSYNAFTAWCLAWLFNRGCGALCCCVHGVGCAEGGLQCMHTHTHKFQQATCSLTSSTQLCCSLWCHPPHRRRYTGVHQPMYAVHTPTPFILKDGSVVSQDDVYTSISIFQ